MSSVDYGKPIEIADNVFWVGYVIPNDPFQCHVYVIRNGSESILIDPGSMITFPVVLEKIYKVLDLRDIKYIIMHHQDPDIVSCYSVLESIMPPRERYIVTHQRTHVLLKHYQWKTPFYLIDQHDWKLTAGDRELEFVFTPYAHFPGAFCSFDRKTKTLFSSDIFGAISDKFSLFLEDDEELFEGIELFHKHYMPSRTILDFALRQIERKNPELIAPQHGSIIGKRFIKTVIDRLRKIDCGLYLLNEEETDVFILNKAESVLKKFLEDAILSSSLNTLINNLFCNIKKEVSSLRKIIIITQPGIYEGKEGNIVYIEVSNVGINKEIRKEIPNIKNYSYSLDLKTSRRKIGKLYLISDELNNENIRFLSVLFKKISFPLAISLEKELTYEMIEKANKELYEKAIRDYLTSLYNRSYFVDYLKKKIEESRQYGIPITIAMIDIDHFKRINDTYGHIIGDCVLKEIASLLQKEARSFECAARYGGEEFVLVMPFTKKEDACKRMENLRKRISSSVFCKNLHVTVSIGIAEYKEPMTINDFINEADKNLYKAKKGGRNKVVC
jgi:diguanylate cyclase (GGDEF)-like protein